MLLACFPFHAKLGNLEFPNTRSCSDTDNSISVGTTLSGDRANENANKWHGSIVQLEEKITLGEGSGALTRMESVTEHDSIYILFSQRNVIESGERDV